MNNCIFCQIIQEKITADKVYEDKDYLAFLDINPFNPGHTLVIPKKHYRWVWQVDNPCLFWTIANKIALAINKIMNPQTVLFVTSGFEIPHAHIHVIPRFKQDGHGRFLNIDNKKKITSSQMKKISRQLVASIKRGGVL